MPLVRISLMKGRTPDALRAIADAVHGALVETFDVPQHDRFQIIEQREPHELIYDPGYLGIERTDGVVLIDILASGTRDAVAKHALYAAIADRLADAGLRREDTPEIPTV